MKMTPRPGLATKIAELECDLERLESTVAEKQQKRKTVLDLATERINDPRRWPHASDDDAAATLTTFGDKADEADEADESDNDQAQKPATHRFETMVAMIAERDNVPKTVAAARARKEFPALFADYQNTARAVSKSFDGLVRDEIRKGFSDLVAAQRVAALYPALSRQAIAKSESGVAEFMLRVSEIMKRDRVPPP